MSDHIIITNNFIIFPIIFVANVFLLSILNWFEFKKQLKSDTIFDISIISILGGIIISRLLGIIVNLNYYLNKGWTGSLFIEESGNVYIANQMPWGLLNIFDGNYLYSGFILGVVFSISIIFLYSNQKKSVLFLFDKVAHSLSVLLTINLSLFWIARSMNWFQWGQTVNFNFNNLNIDIISIQILILILLIIITKVFKLTDRNGLLTVIFYAVFASSLIINNIIKNYLSNSNLLELDSIIAVLFYVFAIIAFIQMRNKEDMGSDELLMNENLARRGNLMNTSFNNRSYIQAYSRTEVSKSGVPVNERLTGTLKYFKRRFK
jgi:hypothetical protein